MTPEEKRIYDEALVANLDQALENMVKRSEQLNATPEGRKQLAGERADREAERRRQRAKDDKQRAEKLKYDAKISKIKKAAEKNTLWRLKRIVRRGVDDRELAGAMFSATIKGRLKNVQFLHKAGAAVNTENTSGASLFMLAIGRGHTDIARYLLEHGADVNHVDKYGNSALAEVFLSSPSLECVRLLISAGAKLNTRDRYGFPPLIKAIQAREYDIAEALLRGGADVNIIDGNRMTPLMHAVSNNELRIVKWLVDGRAEVNIQDNEGRTAAMHIRPYHGPSCEKQIAYAKKNGVDLYSFTSYREAEAALKASGLEYESYPDKHAIFVHVPNESVNILWFLKKKGMDLNIRNNSGDTVPHVLIKKDFRMPYLFTKGFLEGFDLSLEDGNGETYIMASIGHNYTADNGIWYRQ